MQTEITREEFLSNVSIIFSSHIVEIEELMKQMPKPMHYCDRGMQQYFDELYVLLVRLKHMADHRIRK